jgi:copper chaperone CopZ
MVGIACGHCASSVAEALNALAGVSEVQIALVPAAFPRITTLVPAAAPITGESKAVGRGSWRLRGRRYRRHGQRRAG